MRRVLCSLAIVIFTSIFITCESKAERADREHKERVKEMALNTRLEKKAYEGADTGALAAYTLRLEMEIEENNKLVAEECERINVETLLLPLEERLLANPSDDNLPESIWKVFLNDAPFTDAYFGLDFTLSKYNICTEYPDISDWEPCDHRNVCWREFTILDFDGDGENELLYLVTDENNAHAFYILFHEIGGKVYSYRIFYRSMCFIKEDGTIEASDGAADNDVYRITAFYEDGYDIETHGKMCSYLTKNGEDLYGHFYFVNDEEVTEEYYYNVFLKEQNGKENVKWNSE